MPTDDVELELSLLNGHGDSLSPIPSSFGRYAEKDTIDWFEEESNARLHSQSIRSARGVRGVIASIQHGASLWFVLLVTGVGIGLIGASLDILVAWFADIRIGRCSHNILYNQTTCCNGYDPGEICTDWLSWADYLNIRLLFLRSLMHSFTYAVLSMCFAVASAFLVQSYAPYAFHTGIPEIKAILSGYVFNQFLSAWTLLIKSLGLALAVASGLSLGKEGPLVHVACCMAFVTISKFPRFRDNEAEKRRILAAAAAAGVSVAFGSPLGGVLFALEELDVFHEEVMWRSFATSVIAAVSLQYIDPFGTSKLVLFQVTASKDDWRAFELIPWLLLGAIGGLVGSLLIKLNVAVAKFRHTSQLASWPLMEVAVASAVTATISYLVVFMRVPTSELVSNLFQECIPNADYHGLCNQTAVGENIFLLLISSGFKIVLTAWTFGMMVPAGIFLPTIAIGACLGRVFGLATQALHRHYGASFLFASCPADPTVPCISPGFYAVIGAAATLAGVTRMTISLVVIMFELTGALSHVLPIMIAVVSSKWVADSFGTEGIYAVWIAMRGYPWISAAEFKDGGRVASSHMIPEQRIMKIDDDTCTLSDIKHLLRSPHSGFPVISHGQLAGYVSTVRLELALANAPMSQDSDDTMRCTFIKSLENDGQMLDFKAALETPAILLRDEIPLEMVVSIFQKMNLRYLLFTKEGRLTGMMTKTDVVAILTSHLQERNILKHEMDEQFR